jgi:hypothetical protein
MTGPLDRPTEDLLRRALESRAAEVEIDPAALAHIRARTHNRTWWHRIRGGAMPLAFTSAAATAVVATITSVFLTMGSCTPPSGEIPGESPSVSQPTETPAPASQSPSPQESQASPAGQTNAGVPVYYLNDYRTKPMLYREFHRLAVGDGSTAARTTAAVTEMLDGRNAYDPDYISTWPASAEVRNVTVSGSVVTVDLSGAAVNGFDPPSEYAALEQLIWTATAASGADGMKLLLDGAPVAKLWNLIPVGTATLHRAAYVDVVAPVWVIDPQEGAVVGRDGVTINVAGIVFEATMRVRVRNSANKIVFDQTITLDNGPPAQGKGTLRTPALAPGRYTVEGFFISAADSSIQAMDAHSFTVS